MSATARPCASSSASCASKRCSPASRAREIDITFNPRTPGANRCPECPDTQTQPSEVDRDRASDDAEETSGSTMGDFDLRAFTAELERAMEAPATSEGLVLEEEEAMMEAEDEGYDYDVEDEGEPLNGRELALMCIKKYGKAHDMAIKHVKMGSGMKRWVSLNLYVGHLGQRSYPQTEAQYLEQLDVIAYLINSWGQAEYTRAFFREKPIARRGLPSRPRVDTCVTLQFARSPTWNDDLSDEYFDF
ncbi:hypothetical protein BE221DRAFT_172572 [Ostreococcus tauri]|uniref:Uncharacterized protein n=1 Tax=Ostreococcus tauri TaxID=70448 RepID=A0A1Y5IF75_OSTTA|nr:hypothetical protein BE221DRAFT_172572 [Ostreococcus tauri]